MRSLRQSLDIGLVILAVGLGVYLAATSGNPTTSEFSSRKNHVLPLFVEEEIQQIQIMDFQSGSEVLLRRDKGDPDSRRYLLGETGTQVADPAQIGELFHLLSAATFHRSWPTDAVDSPQTDFSSPHLELRIKAGARSYRVLVGKKVESPESAFYTEVSGSNVEPKTGVVDSTLVEGLSRPEREYRGGLLFPYSRSRTSTFELHSPKGTLTLSSDGHGFFVKQEARRSEVRADRTIVDLLFFQLAGAQINPHLDAKTVSESLQKSESELFRLTMKGPDGPAVDVQVGSSCPDDPGALLALRTNPDPLAGCVSRSLLAALALDPENFESRSVALFNPDEIDHVIITRGKDRLGIMRKDAGFVLSNKAQTPVATDAGNELFTALAQRKLPAFIPESSSTTTKVGEITIRGQAQRSYDPHDPSNDKSEALFDSTADIYSSGGSENLVIKRREDQVWLAVPRTLDWAFSTDDSWARPRELIALAAEDIAQVTVSTARGSERVRREGREFTREVDGQTSVADPHLTRQLFFDLAHLEARRFVSPSVPRPKEGLLHVTLELLSGEPEREFWLGPRVAGGHLAWASFVKGTFVLPHETGLLLQTPLADRTPLLIEPATLETLELIFDGREYSFERRGPDLAPAGGESSLQMVEALEEALRDLQFVSALPTSEAATVSKTPILRLAGTRIDPQGESKKFQLYFGGPISFQGQALIACWSDSGEVIWGATKGSVDQLSSLL